VETDLVSRFGGDEFLVLLDRVQTIEEAVKVAERLLNALTPAYTVLGHEVYSTASVGIAVSDGCTWNPEEVVRNADVAMYEAKRAGRGCSVVFNEAMHARLARHLTIETSLRRAIAGKELHLRYRPVVDLESGERRSVEAVPAWIHPTLGPIQANEFLPIAEESGLLIAISQWMLEEACKNMAEWRQTQGQGLPQTVSIELSRSQLALGDRLVEQLSSLLEVCGLPAGCLQLEISEQELERNPEAAGKMFRDIHRLGIKTAIGRFGAGHCSLAVLRSHPLDTVKIDRSFLVDLHGSHGSLAVISATLTLVGNLGLLSVAEGVENSTEIAILQSLGCRCAQGPVFGGSMMAAEVAALPALVPSASC
jgi:predicted signal transduction protein with EAL and GGDEF domain